MQSPTTQPAVFLKLPTPALCRLLVVDLLLYLPHEHQQRKSVGYVPKEEHQQGRNSSITGYASNKKCPEILRDIFYFEYHV